MLHSVGQLPIDATSVMAACQELVWVNGKVALLSLSSVAARQPDGAHRAGAQRMGLRGGVGDAIAAKMDAKQGRAKPHAGVPVRVRERQSPHGGGVQGGERAGTAVGEEERGEGQRAGERSAGNAARTASRSACAL